MGLYGVDLGRNRAKYNQYSERYKIHDSGAYVIPGRAYDESQEGQ